MKTRTWILIFAALSAICLILSILFFVESRQKNTALVYSDGILVKTIDLQQDAEYRIDFGDEWNILTVKDGTICVSASSCASHDCIRQGNQNGGAPIVCLPNHLMIEFSDSEALDAVLR